MRPAKSVAIASQETEESRDTRGRERERETDRETEKVEKKTYYPSLGTYNNRIPPEKDRSTVRILSGVCGFGESGIYEIYKTFVSKWRIIHLQEVFCPFC